MIMNREGILSLGWMGVKGMNLEWRRRRKGHTCSCLLDWWMNRERNILRFVAKFWIWSIQHHPKVKSVYWWQSLWVYWPYCLQGASLRRTVWVEEDLCWSFQGSSLHPWGLLLQPYIWCASLQNWDSLIHWAKRNEEYEQFCRRSRALFPWRRRDRRSDSDLLIAV